MLRFDTKAAQKRAWFLRRAKLFHFQLKYRHICQILT